MADITLSVFEANRPTGVNVTDNDTAVTDANVYFFPNNGNVRLLVANGATANTVTVVTPGTVNGLAIADLPITLLANKQYVLGPFPTSIYNNQAGLVRFTVTENADVLVVRG